MGLAAIAAVELNLVVVYQIVFAIIPALIGRYGWAALGVAL